MKYGTIAHINEDGSVNVRFTDGDELNDVPKLYGYEPVIFEQVLIADVEPDQHIALGAVYSQTPGVQS